MADPDWIPIEAGKSLERLMPRMEELFRDAIERDPEAWRLFQRRLEREWPRLFSILVGLYGWQYDFFYHLEQILSTAARSWLERPAALKRLDRQREDRPDWFQSEEMVGGVLYVDLFSDNLAKLPEHIPYFRKLGLTYLHLMPLFAVPRGDSDGGYAVSDYRSVHPDMGTMEELARLAGVLRTEGISLVLDFVFNHTSEEHLWARRAKAGEPEFQAYYHTFADRDTPDRFQPWLRDIFPTVRKGSFTWCEDMHRWVWTTFNSFQWDLNYGNPEVFRAMAEEMLFLANQGVEILRLDAVAFIWKRMGTDCENQPEAHRIIRAFNALARIAAPALLFKSEAIVHPDEVIRYVDVGECQLSYNPLLMALLWEALATREVKLLANAMTQRGRLPAGCAWVNYLRCHDDIGWTFDDEDARQLGIDPAGHRRFLNDFYTGRFAGSFSRGVPFQFNPDSGDERISGTLASLAGLEKAVESGDPASIETAIRRINLLRSIMLSIGGIPLIYIGDEWGMLNDYTYLSNPQLAGDSRWVHRISQRWRSQRKITDADTLEWRFFRDLVHLIELRKQQPAFRNGGMTVLDTGNPHLFGYRREGDGQRVVVVNNFSELTQTLTAQRLRSAAGAEPLTELISGAAVDPLRPFALRPYQAAWLGSRSSG